MQHLVIFFIASLFFHTLSSSSENIKLNNQLEVIKGQVTENVKLAVKLLRAFGVEKSGSKNIHTICIVGANILVPFTFPISDSYDMDLSTELSKKAEISSQRMFSILVQIICALLHFHIARLFNLEPSEPFILNPQKNDRAEWEHDSYDWFVLLLGAIMPGAIFNLLGHDGQIIVNRIYVKPFQFLKKDDNLFGYSTRKDGILENLILQCDKETPTVSIYSLPTHLLGKELTPDQAVMHSISLAKSYPPCKKILKQLLQGVTFAFSLNHTEVKIIVEPTKDIPSVEKSRKTLMELFKAPIGTKIMMPENVENALRKNSAQNIMLPPKHNAI